MDPLTLCTLCAALAFGPVESRPLDGAAHSPPTDHFALYAGAGFPVWTWHSLQPLRAESQYLGPYRMLPPSLGTPPGLSLVPKWEDWTTELDETIGSVP